MARGSRWMAQHAVMAAALTGGMILAGTSSAEDKKVEVVPFVGYEGGGTFHFFDGFDDDFGGGAGADVESGASFGFNVAVSVAPHYRASFLYAHQDTELTASPGLFAPGTHLFDLSVEHFQGGIQVELGEEAWRPFFEGMIGASRFAPDGDGFDDEWFFSGSLGGGIKLYLSEHMGLQFKARYIPVVVHSSDDVFCDAFGCFSAVDRETLSRGEASAGVLFRF